MLFSILNWSRRRDLNPRHFTLASSPPILNTHENVKRRGSAVGLFWEGTQSIPVEKSGVWDEGSAADPALANQDAPRLVAAASPFRWRAATRVRYASSA
jgi:hypothetical protein